jgi:hypothetical protein
MNKILLYLIKILHILLVLFIIISPFLNINFILALHFIIVPFIILHWILNDNKCALTLIEKNIRNRIYGDENDNNDCFTCKLIEPIYDFKSDYETMSHIIYIITISLWIITSTKLYLKYRCGEIKSFESFRI